MQQVAHHTHTDSRHGAQVTWLPTARPTNPDALECLTTRELEILQRVALAASNNEIAEELYLSLRTVEAHLSTIRLKLDLRNRGRGECRVAMALAYLRECGIVDGASFDAIRKTSRAGQLIRIEGEGA